MRNPDQPGDDAPETPESGADAPRGFGLVGMNTMIAAPAQMADVAALQAQTKNLADETLGDEVMGGEDEIFKPVNSISPGSFLLVETSGSKHQFHVNAHYEPGESAMPGTSLTVLSSTNPEVQSGWILYLPEGTILTTGNPLVFVGKNQKGEPNTTGPLKIIRITDPLPVFNIEDLPPAAA